MASFLAALRQLNELLRRQGADDARLDSLYAVTRSLCDFVGQAELEALRGRQLDVVIRCVKLPPPLHSKPTPRFRYVSALR